MPCCAHDVRDRAFNQMSTGRSNITKRHHNTYTFFRTAISDRDSHWHLEFNWAKLEGRKWRRKEKKSSFNIVLEAFYYRENVSYYLTFYGVTQEEPPVCRCSYTLVITVYKSSLITFRRLTKAIKVNNNLSPPFKYLFHFRPSDWKSTGSLRRLVYVPEIVIIGDGRPMTRRIRVMAEDIDNNTILFYKLGGRVGIFLLRFLNVIILCIGYQDFTFIQYTTYSSLLL